MKILLAGGAGYIGSHTCLELLQAGHEVVVADNLSNSDPEAIERVQTLSGLKVSLHIVDLCDAVAVERLFSTHSFNAVIHLAGLKAVGESVRQPLRYFSNNITATLVLLEAMTRHKVKTLVFSSSATVYGLPEKVPIAESAPLSAVNPYGRTKLMIEQILVDICASDPAWHVMALRYFNPAGAHASGMIGEDPQGTPNNLFPYVSQVAAGRHPVLRIWGKDYPTSDGTGVRDYIHVTDLAMGHVCAVESAGGMHGFSAINLGTGRGYSVLEVVSAFSRVCGRELPHEFHPRREGDAASCWADPSLALRLLGWKAERDLTQMCEDAWRWQSRNPAGYRK
jgi:UDP-glucose 4-epimerase